MIRAIRPSAMAQDDAALVRGWNVAPNLAYILRLLPGPASCGVLLYSDANVLIASGAALAGTEQPCILIPQTGQTIGMVDAELGWHLLITTTGTENQREIRIGPAVDLPDEIHPVYGDGDMALARATAAIDAAAHYIDDVTVTCPLGLGAGLGDVVSVPVDGAAVVGQVESVTWTATPDGVTEQSVIRRHVAIAPEAFVEVTPPTVADDTGTATHMAGTSGNVLANDTGTLTVTAVNGMASKVGVAVDGNNGGTFTIGSDGAWTFDPDGDFALLTGSETADTSITYHASDGTAEAMATLTVTVSHANAAPVAVDDTGATTADATTSGNVLANDTDAEGDTLTVSQVAGSAANIGVAVTGSGGGLFTVGADGAWTFDPNSDFDGLTDEQTATTSVTYHVSDGQAEDGGTLTVTVSAAAVSPGISLVGFATNTRTDGAQFNLTLPEGVQAGDFVLVLYGCRSTTNRDVGVLSPSIGVVELFDLYANATNDTNLGASYFFLSDGFSSSVTVTGSGSSSFDASALLYVFRGVSVESPLDATSTVATYTNGGIYQSDCPSITTVTDGAVVIAAACHSSATTPPANPPSGYENLVKATSGFNLYAATKQVDSAGIENPPAFGTNSASSWTRCVATIAIRPA